ncbi:MAG: hypothetical protein AAF802_20235 [Planctomycetota bacterium]
MAIPSTIEDRKRQQRENVSNDSHSADADADADGSSDYRKDADYRKLKLA